MAIGNEVGFSLNSFQRVDYKPIKETVVQMVLNVLFLRPGNLPSNPNIGVNIRQYLYKFEEDVVGDRLRQEIYNQCSDLITFASLGDVQVRVIPYRGRDILVITLPFSGISENDTTLAISIGTAEDIEEPNVAYTFVEA